MNSSTRPSECLYANRLWNPPGVSGARMRATTFTLLVSGNPVTSKTIAPRSSSGVPWRKLEAFGDVVASVQLEVLRTQATESAVQAHVVDLPPVQHLHVVEVVQIDDREPGSFARLRHVRVWARELLLQVRVGRLGSSHPAGGGRRDARSSFRRPCPAGHHRVAAARRAAGRPRRRPPPSRWPPIQLVTMMCACACALPRSVGFESSLRPDADWWVCNGTAAAP